MDLNHVFVERQTALSLYREIEKSIFFLYILNMNISVTINPTHFISSHIILRISVEGKCLRILIKLKLFVLWSVENSFK